MYLRTKFQLDKSKFGWVRQFWKNSQKIQNLKKFECFNRFRPNSIPKFVDECNIFVCSFRTIARILRKLELPRPFFKKFKIPYLESQIGHQLSWKQSRLKCCDCFTSVPNFISIAQAVYELSNRTHAHTHTHTDTSGLQLKITFLDVLDYSEYSDTNISNKNFLTKTASSVRTQKIEKNRVASRYILLSTCVARPSFKTYDIVFKIY